MRITTPESIMSHSLNDNGQIVGAFTVPVGDNISPSTHAFLTANQSSWDLNTLIAPGTGLILSSAIDINDLGQITGKATDAQGKIHNYLLTPTPEPATALVILAGCVICHFARRGPRNRN
ncbi:hypothetical protein P12x_003203 [Tundrisphaera lichenicola]|uniref:hypothetical protein n=1 Tax=Tundrisphaera lichenicola TaxID=2029860 RepID=UPI003EB8B2EF